MKASWGRPYLCSVSKAVSHWALLQPGLLRAEAVGVRIPGWQETPHRALGSAHLLQNPAGVLLQLLHLLADVWVFRGCGGEAEGQSMVPTTTTSRTRQGAGDSPRADLLEYFSETALSFWKVDSSREGSSWVLTSSCQSLTQAGKRGRGLQ